MIIVFGSRIIRNKIYIALYIFQVRSKLFCTSFNYTLQSIGKNLTRDLAVKLISGERVKLKKCISRKSGKTFDAEISVTADAEGKASFSMELPQKGGRK